MSQRPVFGCGRLMPRWSRVTAHWTAGVAFSAKHGEVYGVSGNLNGYTAYIVPEFFAKPGVRQTDSQQQQQ